MIRKAPSLAVLVAITMLNPLALNILQPALPELTRAFNTTYGTIQFTLAFYLITSALAQIVLGPISDRHGRRLVGLIGVIVFVIGSVICVYATSVTVLVFGRIVQAAGGVAGLVVSRAVIRDLYERDVAASKLGYVTMAMVVVPMLSPLVGGWISDFYGYNGIFWFCAAGGALAFTYAFFDLSETRHAAERETSGSFLSAYRILLTSRAFLAHSLTIGFTSATFMTFLAATPHVVIDLQHQSPAIYGLWWIAASIPFMAGNFLAGRLGSRIGSTTLVRIGTALCLPSLALLAAGYAMWPLEPAVLFIATLPVWLGSGMIQPGAVANALSVRPDLAGAASGLSGSIHLGTGALAALLVGNLIGDTAWPMIVAMLVTATIALIASFSAGRPIATWRG